MVASIDPSAGPTTSREGDSIDRSVQGTGTPSCLRLLRMRELSDTTIKGPIRMAKMARASMSPSVAAVWRRAADPALAGPGSFSLRSWLRPVEIFATPVALEEPSEEAKKPRYRLGEDSRLALNDAEPHPRIFSPDGERQFGGCSVDHAGNRSREGLKRGLVGDRPPGAFQVRDERSSQKFLVGLT